jgi:hypothetical protein
MNFWKTARDPFSPLVALLSESFGRLGALVFQPDATEKSYWADALLGIQTRIAGSAAGFEAVLTRGRKNVFPTRSQVTARFGTESKPPQPDRNLSFARWDKVESYQPKKTGWHAASLVEHSQLRQPRRSGCAPAEPYPPWLRQTINKNKRTRKMKKC